ncbi:MAG: hypothetical protein IIB33_00170 [Chloroflexi bacterium]|nr:hypothetical protein [Chloroflexota bacterium]
MAEVRTYRIVTIAGDGIGPEIMELALEVLAETERRVGSTGFRGSDHPGHRASPRAAPPRPPGP